MKNTIHFVLYCILRFLLGFLITLILFDSYNPKYKTHSYLRSNFTEYEHFNNVLHLLDELYADYYICNISKSLEQNYQKNIFGCEYNISLDIIPKCLSNKKFVFDTKYNVPYLRSSNLVYTEAYVQYKTPDLIFFKYPFISNSYLSLLQTILHECVHLYYRSKDYAYMWETEKFSNLTSKEKINNADHITLYFYKLLLYARRLS